MSSFNKKEVEEDMPDFIDVPDFQNPKNQDVRASGYCDKCHNRYTNAKVIDGVIICPVCSKTK